MYGGLPAVVGQVGPHVPVEESYLRCGIEQHFIVYAGQPPVVLTLQIYSVAVFHYVHGYCVTSRPQVGCHVVFGRFLGAFVEAHLLSVYPDERG